MILTKALPLSLSPTVAFHHQCGNSDVIYHDFGRGRTPIYVPVRSFQNWSAMLDLRWSAIEQDPQTFKDAYIRHFRKRLNLFWCLFYLV